MSTPTIEELFDRFDLLLSKPEFQPQCESFEIYFRQVASGTWDPVIRDQNALVAAQCVVVILEHVKNRKGGAK